MTALLASLLLAAASAQNVPPVRGMPLIRNEAELAAFLDFLDVRLEAINTARQLEFYYQLKSLPAPNLKGYQELHRGLFSNRDYALALETWRPKVQDPVLARRVMLYQDVYLDFLYDNFRLAKTDPRVSSEFTELQVALDREITAFKPLYGGARVGRAVVADALRSEPDRARRREAYLASREVSAQLAPRIRRLLLAARKLHRQMGFAGTVEARLRGAGMERAEVEGWLASLEEATREPYRALLERARKDLGVERLEPWDLRYWVERQSGLPKEAFAREKALPRLLALVRGLGFEPEKLSISVEEANLSNAGWNVPIRMGVEARLVVNPFEGRPYYDTLFHEYGHALHEVLIEQGTGTFRTDRPGPWAEGLAEVLAAFVRDPAWQRSALGLSEEQVRQAAEPERLRRLLRIRQLLFMNAFEYAAFDEPESGLAKRYGELMERYLMVKAPEDPPWADDLFLIQPQVYVQNYLVSYMISAQINRTMRERFGPALAGQAGVAAYLRERFYRHGASRDWRDMVREATGKPLGPEALLGELE